MTFALVLVILAIIAGSVYLDMFVMLVGGILRVVHGAQAHPANAHEIVWGVVRAFCSGVFVIVGAIVSYFVWQIGK